MSSFPLVSFLITLMFAAAVCAYGNEEVKDKDGNTVQAGLSYFIVPIKSENNHGGGLYPAHIPTLPPCPLGIIQSKIPYLPGEPVSFTYGYGVTDPNVRVSAIITIKFHSKNSNCNEYSTLWAVDDSSSAIILSGLPGDVYNEFRIEKAGEGPNTYKLSVESKSRGFVGVSANPGDPLSASKLVVTKDDARTLLVKFVKGNDATTAITSTSPVEKLGLRMFPFY